MTERPTIRTYRLVGRVAVPVEEGKWGQMFYERAMAIMASDVDPWRVAFDEIKGGSVSTVFLGIDHNFFGGEPRLFETAIFRNGETEIVGRVATWEQAEELHAETVKSSRHLRVVK